MNELISKVENALDGKHDINYTFATTEFHEDYETIYKNTDKAMELSYEPYPYQKQAATVIDSIYMRNNRVRDTNLLIASPTGSGKTFAIKWAAKRAIQNGYRLIVAVPLVALAEQIFFQLRKLLAGMKTETEPYIPDDYNFDYGYEDDDDYYEYAREVEQYASYSTTTDTESPVGIRTGPSEKFPDAPILVCTYEVVLIQMNQNHRFLDNCPLIIIDEIHMISDPSRGHVPENIMNHPSMPYGTKICGLSGTLPNGLELAEFMGKTNMTETRVIGAKKRPISLDYYIHTGEKIKEKILHKVYNSEERVFDKDKWDSVCEKKIEDKNTKGQTRGKLLGLIQDLVKTEKVPAMVVGFSCKGLNTLSTYLNSIDLCPNKRFKSMVHIEFYRLRKRIPPEEWCLFEHFMDLAKRGIGVHHSQNPKHYLEILPKLVQRGYVKLILSTSTLSAGIDLPVRTVVLMSLKMPSPTGFKQIETNLFHQICGRAGRPGLETQGNVVILRWKKDDVNIPKLLTSPPVPVVSKYRLTPSTILNILQKGNSEEIMETLMRGSFATKTTNHIPFLIRECKSVLKKEYSESIEKIVNAITLLNDVRQNASICVPNLWKHMKRQMRPGKVIFIDPEKGQIKPEKAVIKKVMSGGGLQTDCGIIDPNWVIAIEGVKYKKLDIRTHSSLKTMMSKLYELMEYDISYTKDEFCKAETISKLKYYVSLLQEKLSPESMLLWEEYKKQLNIMILNGFVVKETETPTLKGRMAAQLLATEDPLTLVEFLTMNEYTNEDFIPLLSCFLRQNKFDQPRGGEKYSSIVNIQKNIWTMKNETLGTSMIEPMKMWMRGYPVSYIVRNSDISAGHFCKEALRISELLKQIKDAATTIGNTKIVQICDSQEPILKRGLPFLESSFLR